MTSAAVGSNEQIFGANEQAPAGELAVGAIVHKKIESKAVLEDCRALINQINAALSAEEPFVDASSATELLFCLERAASALKKSAARP
jgi:hypothetical protein